MTKVPQLPIPLTIQSQYAASPTIKALVDGFIKELLPEKDIQLFYDKIFNIYTAEGWGLDTWGRILGIGRYLQVEEVNYFGFAGQNLRSFGYGIFYTGPVTNTYALTDAAYRDLLLMKALSNISSADSYTINKFLIQLFPGQTAYVIDKLDMSIRYVFRFSLTPIMKSIFSIPNLIPRGAAVEYDVYELPAPTFGFAGQGLSSFGYGSFTTAKPIGGTS